MEEIKAPKKERKFLKAVGNIAKALANELVMGIGRKFIGKAIDKVGNKRQGLVIAFALVAGISYGSIDSIPYPITGNKQRLGFQTTGNGLVWRGTAADTVTKPTSYADKNIKAYLILDSVSGSLYVFKQGVWAAISGAGGFEQPIDSLFFNTGVPTNNVDTAKMRWDSDLATVVLGLNDNVPNELGFKNFWLVKNQTGSTITKGSIVYANGTVGASGRITIDKFIADGSIDAKYLLGITAHDLSNGEDGYVISFGKIRKVNTDTFAAGAILYPSPTVAGVWTDVEPIAPNIDMPIGFCINSHANNGTIAIRVASGYKLHELHDLAITSPVEKASLYYSGGLWRDTTEALLVSDTSAFARDNQISGTSGQVAYFNSNNSVVSDTALRWSAANKSLGINMTTVPSGASLIIKNSQEPVRSTVVATQTFGADTTNWTRGAGWTFNGTQAVATAATGALTYTPALTITSGNAYEITYTLSGYSAGALTARIGNATYALPTYNTTANVVLLLPTSASGGFRFTTSTFTGNLDNVSVVQISNPASILFAGQNDNDGTIYSSIQMPSASTIGFGANAGRYATGINNNFFGNNAGARNTTGTVNNFFGNNAGARNTSGNQNNFFGDNAGANNTVGRFNNFFGRSSGASNTTGGLNNFFGDFTGNSNTTGSNNNFFGLEAGRNNISGIDNNFFGYFSGLNNTTGSSNIFIGSSAGLNHTTGSSNVFIAPVSGRNHLSGNNNIFIGRQSGANNISGLRNVMIGRDAGLNTRSGNDNVYLGYLSAVHIKSSNNVILGVNAGNNTVVADSTSGANNIIIGRNAADNIAGAAAANVAIGNQIDLPTNNGSNQGVYQNVLFFTGASGTGTTIAAASKAGIKTNAPNRDLEVAGEVRITDLTTDAPTRLVGADADGDLGQVTLGAGLSLASSSLLADTSFLVTRFDTASMLTNYLRTGVAASTYLTQSNAASTYLPLTGGTLTGGLTGTTGTFNTRLGVGSFAGSPTLFTSGSGDQEIHFTHSDNIPGRKVSLRLTNNNGGLYTYGGLIYAIQGEGLNQYSRMSFGVNTTEIMHLTRFSRVGIMNNSPSYTLDVNGTLGVTGATTLSAPLTVNSSAVFNEGSADADFRVESDGNANMVFVDASTDRVGIGYASPTKTLDVNGEVRINTVTAPPTSLLGKDGSNVVGNVTLGNSLTLSSGTLSVNNKITDINTSEYTILANDLYIDNFNNSSTTIILPLAELNTFRELKFKNSSTGSLIANDNIIPLNGSGTTTTILPATNAKWCTLVSDGGFWRIMQSN
jgi:trimeric autotransporter adhesin